MKIADEKTGMDPQLRTAIQQACDRIARGIPFTRQERETAAAEIARIREENLRFP